MFSDAKSWNLRLAWWFLSFAAFLHSAEFFIPQVQGFGEYLWSVNYTFGFIRRGLLGQLFSMTAGPMAPTAQVGAVILLHRLVFATVFFSMAFWASRSIFQERHPGFQERDPRPPPVAAILFAASLMFTPMWPTQAWLVGYADIFVMGLAFVGFVACEKRLFVPAIAIAAAGPLIHESFLFLWAPVALLGIADVVSGRNDTSWPRIGIISVTPLLSAWLVRILHDPTALEASLERAVLSDPAMKQVLLDQVFNARISSLLAHMRHLFVMHRLTVVLVATYTCAVPVVVALAVAGGSWRSQIDRAQHGSVITASLIVAASFAPLAILLVAWDLSRLLATMTFSASVCLAHAARAGWLVSLESNTGRIAGVLVLVVSLVGYVGTPLPFAYFDHIYLIGPQEVHGPAGRLALELQAAVNEPPETVAPAIP